MKQHERGVCPVCGSEQITYCESDIDGDTIWYKCVCDQCDSTFNECYNLIYVGMEEIEDNRE